MDVRPPALTELRTARVREGLRHVRAAIPRLASLDSALGQRLQARVDLLTGNLEKGYDSQSGVSRSNVNEALEQGEGLLAEALAFVTAAAAGWLGLGGATISLAQTWLDRLSHKAGLPEVGLVVPASTEYAGMQSQVIRLLMPNDGIWGLPVAIHEYGHFVASVLERRVQEGGIPRTIVPVEDLLHEAAALGEWPKLYWHGHELFADAFATAVAGPAYTRYCIEYRFDPALAHMDDESHPSPARRVQLQLHVLDRLGQRGDEWGGYLAAEADYLRRSWEALVATETTAAPLNAILDELQERLIDLIFDDPQIARILYCDHTAAANLGEKLPRSCPPATTPAVIINAAWMARTKLVASDSNYDYPTLDDLAAQAERLFREACASE